MSVKSCVSATHLVDETNPIKDAVNKVSIAGVPSIKSTRSALVPSQVTNVSRVSHRSAKSTQSEKSTKSAKSVESVKSKHSNKSVKSGRSIKSKNSEKSNKSGNSAHSRASEKSLKSGPKSANDLQDKSPSVVGDAHETAVPAGPVSISRRSVSGAVEPGDLEPKTLIADVGEVASLMGVENLQKDIASQGTRRSGQDSVKSHKSSKKSASRASASQAGSGVVGEDAILPDDVGESGQYPLEEGAIPLDGMTVNDYTELYDNDDIGVDEDNVSAAKKVADGSEGTGSVRGALEDSKVSKIDDDGAKEDVGPHSSNGDTATALEKIIGTDGPVNIVNVTARHIRPCHSSMGSVRSAKTHASRASSTVKSRSDRGTSRASCAARHVGSTSSATSLRSSRSSSKSERPERRLVGTKSHHSKSSGKKAGTKISDESRDARFRGVRVPTSLTRDVGCVKVPRTATSCSRTASRSCSKRA